MSSTKAKQTAVQLAPVVALCETNPHGFLIELERLILSGYRLDLEAMVALHPLCCIATVRLPEAGAAT